MTAAALSSWQEEEKRRDEISDIAENRRDLQGLLTQRDWEPPGYQNTL